MSVLEACLFVLLFRTVVVLSGKTIYLECSHRSTADEPCIFECPSTYDTCVVECGISSSTNCNYARINSTSLVPFQDISIICDQTHTCVSLKVDIIAAKSVRLVCNETSSCPYTVISVNNTAEVELSFTGENAFENGRFHSFNSNYTILCSNKRSCWHMDVIIETKIAYDKDTTIYSVLKKNNLWNKGSTDTSNSDSYHNNTTLIPLELNGNIVNCSGYYSCGGSEIIVNSDENMSIHCGNAVACEYAMLNIEDASSVYIETGGENALSGAVINATSTDIVSLACLYGNSCDNVSISIDDSDDFYLNCEAMESCTAISAVLRYVDTIDIECSYEYSCAYSWIVIEDGYDVSIISSYDYALFQSDISIESHDVSIQCLDTNACKHAKFDAKYSDYTHLLLQNTDTSDSTASRAHLYCPDSDAVEITHDYVCKVECASKRAAENMDIYVRTFDDLLLKTSNDKHVTCFDNTEIYRYNKGSMCTLWPDTDNGNTTWACDNSLHYYFSYDAHAPLISLGGAATIVFGFLWTGVGQTSEFVIRSKGGGSGTFKRKVSHTSIYVLHFLAHLKVFDMYENGAYQQSLELLLVFGLLSFFVGINPNYVATVILTTVAAFVGYTSLCILEFIFFRDYIRSFICAFGGTIEAIRESSVKKSEYLVAVNVILVIMWVAVLTAFLYVALGEPHSFAPSYQSFLVPIVLLLLCEKLGIIFITEMLIPALISVLGGLFTMLFFGFNLGNWSPYALPTTFCIMIMFTFLCVLVFFTMHTKDKALPLSAVGMYIQWIDVMSDFVLFVLWAINGDITWSSLLLITHLCCRIYCSALLYSKVTYCIEWTDSVLVLLGLGRCYYGVQSWKDWRFEKQCKQLRAFEMFFSFASVTIQFYVLAFVRSENKNSYDDALIFAFAMGLVSICFTLVRIFYLDVFIGHKRLKEDEILALDSAVCTPVTQLTNPNESSAVNTNNPNNKAAGVALNRIMSGAPVGTQDGFQMDLDELPMLPPDTVLTGKFSGVTDTNSVSNMADEFPPTDSLRSHESFFMSLLRDKMSLRFGFGSVGLIASDYFIRAIPLLMVAALCRNEDIFYPFIAAVIVILIYEFCGLYFTLDENTPAAIIPTFRSDNIATEPPLSPTASYPQLWPTQSIAKNGGSEFSEAKWKFALKYVWVGLFSFVFYLLNSLKLEYFWCIVNFRRAVIVHFGRCVICCVLCVNVLTQSDTAVITNFDAPMLAFVLVLVLNWCCVSIVYLHLLKKNHTF